MTSDIFYPFEYPMEWVYEGRSWNESYLLRAFLMYNNSFKIKLFSRFMHIHHRDSFSKMTLYYKNRGGEYLVPKELNCYNNA